MTVVLLLAASLGASAGKSQAQSLIVVDNTREVAKGLKYFYNDNNRFPTLLEYQNQNLMLNYFNYFQPQDFISGNCSESFEYKRVDGDNFQLNFCLPSAVNGYKSGWNQVNQGTKF